RFTIIGVAPPGFRGTMVLFSPDLFAPLVNQEQVEGMNILDVRGNRRGIVEVLGHLMPGVTPDQATADLKSVGSYLEKTYPNENGPMRFKLVSPGLGGDFIGRPLRGFMVGLMLLAGLILLAACANLGSLFAARTADRSREVALRLALGSNRLRIVQQLLTEAALISLAGGAAGLWGSIALLRGLSTWKPFSRFSFSIPVTPDASVYGVASALALLRRI